MTPHRHHFNPAPGAFDRAMADLRDHAALMAARGYPPVFILGDLAHRAGLHRRAGVELAADVALEVVRALPGLATWDALAAIQEQFADLPDGIADGIDSPQQDALDRRHRAAMLAGWLIDHGETDLAAAIVDAAEAFAVEAVTAERADRCQAS